MDEREVGAVSGWSMLPIAILVWLLVPAMMILGITAAKHGQGPLAVGEFLIEGLLVLLAIFLSAGFFSLQPNEARVLVLFGDYRGTVRRDGFHWANAFSVHRGSFVPVQGPVQGQNRGVSVTRTKSKYVISLRARNFETQTLKVNDQRGNPIEIGAVVVWRVQDTAKAMFDVDEYEHYVRVQSETAVRHLANTHPYDHAGDSLEGEVTLRGSADPIAAALKLELEDRLAKAGVAVVEARLTHLAYAPEIAGAMLRRQQAEAIIAARQKIVHGAVSMVQMALTELAEKKVVDLDEERKAAMVGNLLVVLCGMTEAEPVINAGTLYH